MKSAMTRRHFLERAMMAGASLTLPARSFLRPPRTGMFVSLNGALTAGKNVGGPGFAGLAARVGYGGVDWSLDAAQAEGLERTTTLIAELKIEPTIANLPMPRPLPFGGDEAQFRDALVKLADQAAFGAAIGCRKMMVVL